MLTRRPAREAHEQVADSIDWLLAITVTCFGMFALVLLSGGVVSYVYTLDISFMLDAMWRSAEGQVPHIDFHTPVGQGFYWPFMILARFYDISVMGMLKANVIVGVVLLIMGIFSLRSRFSGPHLFLALLVIVSTSISPRDIGKNFDVISHLALYNRWGWSFLVLIALVFLVPPRSGHDTRNRDVISGVVGGAGLAYLFLLKATYFVGGIGLLAFAVVLRLARPRLALVCLVVLAAALLVTELCFGNLKEYWADISNATKVSTAVDPSLRLGKIKRHVLEGAGYGALIGAILWLWWPTLNLLHWTALWWRELLVGAVMVSGGALLASQNHPFNESPLYLGAVVAVAELARRKVLPSNTFAAARSVQALRPLLVVGGVAFVPALDAAAIVRHTWVTNSDFGCRLAALKGSPGEHLMLPPAAFAQQMNLTQNCALRDGVHLTKYESDLIAYHAGRIAEGYALLKRYATKQDVVLALDFANPFPALLQQKSPRGSLVWWDRGRTFSETHHPNAQRLIGEASVVLVAYPGDYGPYAQGARPPAFVAERGARVIVDISTKPLWLIYGPLIERDFELVAQGAYWHVWRSRPSR